MYLDVNIDVITNGSLPAAFADAMPAGMRFDPGILRPYIDSGRNKCVTLNTWKTEQRKGPDGKYILNAHGEAAEFPIYKKVDVLSLQHRGVFSPVFNATGLRRDEWRRIDSLVVKSARKRLSAWSDLVNSGNVVSGFDAMTKSVLEYETMNDPGEAVVDMDGLTPGRRDTPLFQLEGTPLPITHSDFWFSSRVLAISRSGNTPLDTVMGEASGRRVAETVEQTLIGTVTGLTYGKQTDYTRAPTVYGYTNYPDRITKTDMTTPDGTNGDDILTDWIALRQLLIDANQYGPFMAYVSRDYVPYLDNLFSTTEPSAGTLRSKLMMIDGLRGIKMLDYLTNTFTVLFVIMDPETVQAINGMDITTVMWETSGGMRLNFKVMAIQVPRIRSTYDGVTGIAHGTTA